MTNHDSYQPVLIHPRTKWAWLNLRLSPRGWHTNPRGANRLFVRPFPAGLRIPGSPNLTLRRTSSLAETFSRAKPTPEMFKKWLLVYVFVIATCSSSVGATPGDVCTAHNNCGSGEYCYTVSSGGACSACHSNNVCAIYGNSIDGDCSACSSPSSPSSPPSSPSAAPVTALKAGLLSIVFSLIGSILVM